tara:strand:- start:382 stop:696 length:315 start_codon:yes stop_codon:yes gene_type:complete
MAFIDLFNTPDGRKKLFIISLIVIIFVGSAMTINNSNALLGMYDTVDDETQVVVTQEDADAKLGPSRVFSSLAISAIVITIAAILTIRIVAIVKKEATWAALLA